MWEAIHRGLVQQLFQAGDEERRVVRAIKLIIRAFPDSVISVDTFRSEIALEAVLEAGALMINDISGGDADREMFSVVERLNVPT